MSNQYLGSFEHIANEQYGCTSHELLKRFSAEGKYCADISQELNVSMATVRKWARRCGVRIKGESDRVIIDNNVLAQGPKYQYSILSRRWC